MKKYINKLYFKKNQVNNYYFPVENGLQLDLAFMGIIISINFNI